MQEVYDKVKQFDLFGVSETHLLPKNGKQLDLYQDFHSYRKHGKRRNYGSGGISIYIKNNIVKDKDYCPIEIIKGLTDKGQFQ